MHAIPKKLGLLSVIVLLMVLIGTNRLPPTDTSLTLNGVSSQTVPHRVDMHQLANAFK